MQGGWLLEYHAFCESGEKTCSIEFSGLYSEIRDQIPPPQQCVFCWIDLFLGGFVYTIFFLKEPEIEGGYREHKSDNKLDISQII